MQQLVVVKQVVQAYQERMELLDVQVVQEEMVVTEMELLEEDMVEMEVLVEPELVIGNWNRPDIFLGFPPKIN